MNWPIPVVWLGPDNQWDQGMTRELLTNRLGRTGYEFEHHDNMTASGYWGVVVCGARYMDAAHVNEAIARFDHVVLMLTSDEESTFPWRELEHPDVRLWVMTPRPDLHPRGSARFVGEGYAPGTHEALRAIGPRPDRDQPVRFMGQVTHQRRQDCARAIEALGEAGECYASPGFTQGHTQREYLERLADTEMAPCPAGPATPDSFRLYEALEAGCIPVADEFTPERWPGYWALLLNEDDPPFPIVQEWGELLTEADESVWPEDANRAFAWWQRRKLMMVDWLRDDLAAMDAPPEPGLAEQITVVITTSPVPSHPDADLLTATIQSVRQRLPECRIVLAFDGVRAEQEDMRADYEAFIQEALWLANFEWGDVVPLVSDEHRHQAHMTARALEHVTTPMILFVEHDTPLVGDTDWDGIARAVSSGEANVVRLGYKHGIPPEHRYLNLDETPQVIDGVPMVRTAQWSQRPHVASADWYRKMLRTYFGRGANTFIEDCVYSACEGAYREQGEAGWDTWRVWLYTPEGTMQRSIHLNGRAGDDKHEPIFEYDDGVPPHAPWPTSLRED